MEKALHSGADALILDLEDAVASEAKPEARKAVAAFLEANASAALWVRINPLDGGEAEKDLDAILPGRPDGIRSEEHTSEPQSLMRISYAVFCLKTTHCST